MNSTKDFKIDFIGIGAMKAASSWIFQCLKEHPKICGSSKKETHYFDKDYNYRKGLNYYKDFFGHCSSEELKGEVTPGYLYYEEAPERIHELFPKIKLIVNLRNPIERAYSHYRFNKRRGGRTSIYDSFKEAIEKSNVLIEKGFYYEQLKRYFDLFPKENIYVGLFSNLKEDPEAFMQKIYNFLDITPSEFTPPRPTKKKMLPAHKNQKYLFLLCIIFFIKLGIK